MEPALLPRRHCWTREDSFVSLSQSDNRPQIFVGHKSMHKLSHQIVVNKMAEDVGLRALARERILETFEIESLKDLEREALEMLVGGRDVFLIQPAGSGKYLIFSLLQYFSTSDVMPKCAKSIVFVISHLVSLMLDQVHFLKSLAISAEIIGDEQNYKQARTCRKRTMPWRSAIGWFSFKTRRSRLPERNFHTAILLTRHLNKKSS